MQHRLSIVIVVLLITAVGGVAPTVQARTKLNGTYAFTSVRTCTQTLTNTPFIADASGAPTVIPTGGVLREEAVDSGVTTFNADGTGTTTSTGRTMNLSNFTIGGSIFSVSESSDTFTYTVNADDTVDLSIGEVKFKTVLGTGAGNTGTVSPRSARLQVGDGANTLVSAPRTEIEQETIVFNLANDGSITRYRICTRSSTLVKM